MSYTHLTREERYQTWALLDAGYSQRQIARRLDRSPSTVCREFRCNRGLRGYRSKHAHRLAQEWASCCRSHTRFTPQQWRAVERLVRHEWSPELIAQQASGTDSVTESCPCHGLTTKSFYRRRKALREADAHQGLVAVAPPVSSQPTSQMAVSWRGVDLALPSSASPGWVAQLMRNLADASVS